MRRFLLAGTLFVDLATLGWGARATTFDLTYTGSLVTFTVPTTGTYQILAFGAQGGTWSNPIFTNIVGTGGVGAEIGGDFTLTAGEVLQIAVGGASHPGGFPGGGGGSFVIGPGNTPLVIAGGGGGGGLFVNPETGMIFGPDPGGGGLTGHDGGGADPFRPSPNGINGSGGAGGDVVGQGGGGGGGGFLSAGGKAIPGGSITGGGAFPDLTGGNPGGGFGGGGGGGPGGGGGYSGGAGGGFHAATGCEPCSAGGGGSWDAGTDQILVADVRRGDGEVVITELVPEPASIASLGAGLVGLIAIWRRRRSERFIRI